MEARTSKINLSTHEYNPDAPAEAIALIAGANATRRAASIDPSSKSYQRIARRIAKNALRGAVKAVCLLGDAKDIREASYLLAGVLARVQSAGGGK